MSCHVMVTRKRFLKTAVAGVLLLSVTASLAARASRATGRLTPVPEDGRIAMLGGAHECKQNRHHSRGR